MVKKLSLILGFIFCGAFLSRAQSIDNLVFEGAGIRGIAYSGAIRELEDRGLMPQVKKVGGTSAGAITALMVSLGYSADEIYQIITNTRFQKFNDGQYVFVGGSSRLVKRYGWYKGDEFSEWLAKIIRNKTGNAEITFRELKAAGFKDLYVTGTCLNRQRLMIFSAETYPLMKVKDAVRISMSVPLYFEAVFIDSVGHAFKKPPRAGNFDIVVDGGIIGNFPIFIFDALQPDSLGRMVRIPNPKTIGVRIDTDEQILRDKTDQQLTPMPINNIGDYLSAFYVIVIENLNRNQLLREDWERTISISSVGIGPKIRRLSEEQKSSLIRSGEKSAREFLGQWQKGQP